MARERRGRRPTGTRPGGARSRALTVAPALLLALLGLAGLLPTIRSAPPPPPAREPIRYPSGQPAAERLVVLLAPQLGEREVLALRDLLAPGLENAGASFDTPRPAFMSFDDISLVLLAGNGPSAATPPAPADQPPDTLIRSVTGQGRRVAAIGPPEWRALLGLGESPAGAASAPPKPEALLGEATDALAAREAALVLVQVRELAARDLRDEPGAARAGLAQLGAQLGAGDALLLVGGGGAIGDPLHLTLAGAGVRPARLKAVALNDLAPTAAALLGAPFPSEVRGRIAWGLLAADERRKAEATAGLARQRTWLAIGAVPFGAEYPATLRRLAAQVADADAAITAGNAAFGYQLASSILETADRQLADLAGATPLPPPRRAAWGLVAPALAAALLALLAAALARAWGTLAAAAAGGAAALGAWAGLGVALQRVIVPSLATVVLLTLAHAALGGGLAAWLARRWSRPRPTLAIDLLVLLTALPIAACAYRYGLPWRLRLEEAAPLFLWRSALLAPAGLLALGYGALWGMRVRREA